MPSIPPAVQQIIHWATTHPKLAVAGVLIVALLLLFGDALESDTKPGKSYTRAHLVNASPRKFEELTADAFSKRGYQCEVLPEGPDDGLDVIAENRHETIGIQAKRYQTGNTVGGPTVRRVAGAAQQRGVDRAAIATSSTFTDPAIEAGEALDIELIDGNQLADELSD